MISASGKTAILAVLAAALACSSQSGDAMQPTNAGGDARMLDARLLDGAGAPGCAARDDGILRVMTYNIRHGYHSDLPTIAEVINAAQPDIVGIQEVDVNTIRSGRVDQPEELGRLTGMEAVFHRAIDWDDGVYGLALLSCYPIVSSEHYFLTSNEEQRIVLVADVMVGSQPMPIAVTHLGQNQFELGQQPRDILAVLGEDLNQVILMGDMNDSPGGTAIQILEAELRDVWPLAGEGPGYTASADAPNRRHDYIFLGPAQPAPTLAWTISTTASDHLPVLADLPAPAQPNASP